MNEGHSIQMGKWYGLLVFAAGSVLTAIIAALDTTGIIARARFDPTDRSIMSGVSPSLGLILLCWVVLGIVTGAWILLSARWRHVVRQARRRLALAFFAIGWGGLFGMSVNTPVFTVVLVAGFIAVALVFLAYEMEGRRSARDEGDIFP